jgi:hypothetical protein
MTFFGMMTGYQETEVKDEHAEMVSKAVKKIKKQN